MDTLNDQFPPGYYARATTDQGKTPLPFYVFDSEVMLEHFYDGLCHSRYGTCASQCVVVLG